MAYLGALVIFLLVAIVTWFMAVALYHLLTNAPDLRQNPLFVLASVVTILLVTLSSFIPFPAGYVVSLVFWWLAAKNFLELSLFRALLLFVILAALSIVSRLAMIGVLNY
jgi:hypothetical protein